jgi:hypothetical protein
MDVIEAETLGHRFAVDVPLADRNRPPSAAAKGIAAAARRGHLGANRVGRCVGRNAQFMLWQCNGATL